MVTGVWLGTTCEGHTRVLRGKKMVGSRTAGEMKCTEKEHERKSPFPCQDEKHLNCVCARLFCAYVSKNSRSPPPFSANLLLSSGFCCFIPLEIEPLWKEQGGHFIACLLPDANMTQIFSRVLLKPSNQ